MAADDDSLSEDDGVFTDSDGERLDYSGESSPSEGEDKAASGSEEEDSAIETDEDEATAKRRKKRKEKRIQQPKAAKKAKKSRFIDTEAAVSEDDNDSEEEEYSVGRYKKKEKNKGRDEEDDEEEEEEDDDDEEDEEASDDDDGFVDNEIEGREKEFNVAFKKRLEAHAARREAARKNFEEEMNPTLVEERLRQLYGRTKKMVGDGTATAATLATVLQPQASDPKLWLVKCRPGSERMAVASLMRGLFILGDDHGIYSVIGRDSLKGFIYVEAHKVGEIMNAVQKTKTNHLIFASPINRPVMVPLAEMADVLAAPSSRATALGGGRGVIPDISTLKIGGWVRIKRGKYSGDLAQIIEIDQDNSGEVVDYVLRVKLLPRLSYNEHSGSRKGARGATTGKNQKDRPSPRPFDPQEATQYGQVTKARGYWLFNGEAYKDGFLFKDVRASSLFIDNILPRPDELERFGALSLDDNDSGHLGPRAAIDASILKLTKGEAIIVTRGEFQNLTGIVESKKEGDMVEVRFDDFNTFKEPVLVHEKYLSRKFQVGDMIRIMVGEHGGKSGMIVALEQEGNKRMAVIFLAADNHQITIPFTYITTATSIGLEQSYGDNHAASRPGRSEKISFDIHDLVTIENDDGEAGIIIRLMEQEKLATVVDYNGQSRKLPFSKLTKKISTSQPSMGRYDSAILKIKDRVQFSDNPGEIRPATIINIFRQTAFIQSIDNGEILARPLSSLSKPTAYPGISTNNSSPAKSNSMHRGPPLRHLIGKSVTISGAGPYKGYVGVVRELTDTHARVELHTDSRVVSILRERVAIPGQTLEPPLQASRRSSAWNDAKPAWDTSSSTKAPAWGSSSAKTPAWGSSSAKTPAWGSSSAKTPAWGSSSAKTPAWGSSSAKTPAWGSSSSKTPTWGSSSAKTPAWGSSSAKTPAWGASSAKTPAWGGTSSRTPAVGGDGGKTPAWQSVDAGGNSSNNTNVNTKLPPWVIPGAEITIKNNSGHSNILSILPGGKVQIAGNAEPLSFSDLAPVLPAKKDAVRILGDGGAMGTVIGLDGPDAVIRVDGTADFKIVPISGLVKINRSTE